MADQHIPQLTCSPGAENEFSSTEKWFIDIYDSAENGGIGDWSGITGLPTRWYSDTSGIQAEIVAPLIIGGIHVSNTFWKDINNTGELIYANDGSSIDGGNNYGIIFSNGNKKDNFDRCWISNSIGV